MQRFTLVLALVTASSLDAAAEPGPLVGKPAPRLEISNPVQGVAWSQDDLLGSIVVLDIFQLG